MDNSVSRRGFLGLVLGAGASAAAVRIEAGTTEDLKAIENQAPDYACLRIGHGVYMSRVLQASPYYMNFNDVLVGEVDVRFHGEATAITELCRQLHLRVFSAYNLTAQRYCMVKEVGRNESA